MFCFIISPDKMVISEKMAHKYFNYENPVGKIMQVKELKSIRNDTVSGVFKNISPTSNVQFEGAFAWGNFNRIYTYLQLKENTNMKSFEKN